MEGKNLTDIGATVKSEIVTSLNNTQTIVVGEKTLTFERNKKFGIKRVTEMMIGIGIVGSNGKIINLAKEEYIFTIKMGTV